MPESTYLWMGEWKVPMKLICVISLWKKSGRWNCLLRWVLLLLFDSFQCRTWETVLYEMRKELSKNRGIESLTELLRVVRTNRCCHQLLSCEFYLIPFWEIFSSKEWRVNRLIWVFKCDRCLWFFFSSRNESTVSSVHPIWIQTFTLRKVVPFSAPSDCLPLVYPNYSFQKL